MKKGYSYLLLIILLIIIFIFLSVIQYFNKKYENFSNMDGISDYSYYRCKDKVLGTIIQSIFDTNKINHSNENWNIYIPCGYNNVEEELKKY